jgi:hypothetical protein
MMLSLTLQNAIVFSVIMLSFVAPYEITIVKLRVY